MEKKPRLTAARPLSIRMCERAIMTTLGFSHKKLRSENYGIRNTFGTIKIPLVP